MVRPRNRFPHLNLIVIAVVSVSVVVSVAGCVQQAQPRTSTDASGLPVSPVSVAAIDARPEAHLYYPGSTVLYRTVQPEMAVPGSSPDSAYAEAILATAEPESQIQSWYAAQLSPKGWRCYQSALAAYMSSLVAYRRGSRETFTVGMVIPSLLKANLGIDPPASGTVYQVDYFIAAQGVTLGLGPDTNPCTSS